MRGEQRGTTTERTGVNVGERGERGGSVQLSEDQRSQMKTIIERGHGPRLGRNVNFDVRVGTRIPRSDASPTNGRGCSSRSSRWVRRWKICPARTCG